MKQIIFSLSAILFTISIFAQAPQAINYQGVARNLAGNPLPNQNIGLQIAILQGSSSGIEVYKETHNTTTTELGLFSLQVGKGSVLIGNFELIDWSSEKYYLQIELDENGGENYTLIGSNELLSVPYALYAENSGNSTSKWTSNSKGIHYENGSVGIGTVDPNYPLDIIRNIDSGNRTLLNIENQNTSSRSSAALEVKSGSTERYTVLRMHGDDYSYSWWAKHGQLKTTGDGIIIEATKPNKSGGDIIFVNGSTGGNANIKTVNMKINGEGNVGIGTENPSEKLQIKSGDIYLEDINSGIILKSADGNCWRMKVSNLGQPEFNSVSCPN